MSISKMATTTNPSNIDDGSSQDSDADTESICDVEDDEEKCVNITNTVLGYWHVYSTVYPVHRQIMFWKLCAHISP